MKKIFLFISLVFSTIAYAGGWHTINIDADPMKETEADVAHFYTELGDFIFGWNESEPNAFYLQLDNNQHFEGWLEDSNYITGSVGFYDTDGNFMFKQPITLRLYKGIMVTNNDPKIELDVKQVTFTIFRYIRKKYGSVRFLFRSSNGDYIDITIPFDDTWKKNW